MISFLIPSVISRLFRIVLFSLLVFAFFIPFSLYLISNLIVLLASLVAQMVKSLPPMWEIQVRSLGWEDPLEKEMATHSSTLAWKILWMEEAGRLQSIWVQRVRGD